MENESMMREHICAAVAALCMTGARAALLPVFVYEKDGETIVEDTKGMRTPDFIIKEKLMYYIHKIKVIEL